MLKQFDLGFENPELSAKGTIPIQYNLQKRISKLKYVTYKKIDISITNNNKNDLVNIW